MYELFLETEACEQIDNWAADNNVDAEPIKQACYKNAKRDRTDDQWSDWWVSRCLKNDAHKAQSVDSLMIWRDTPEGHEYWAKIAGWD